MFIAVPITVNADEIGVRIAGVPVQFSDQGPAIVDGRTLVPIREVFEALSFNVEWRPDTQQIILANEQQFIFIALTIGSDTFTEERGSGVYFPNVHSLDVPAQIINGRTMLPLRAVMESIGWSVLWDPDTRFINLEPYQNGPHSNGTYFDYTTPAPDVTVANEQAQADASSWDWILGEQTIDSPVFNAGRFGGTITFNITSINGYDTVSAHGTYTVYLAYNRSRPHTRTFDGNFEQLRNDSQYPHFLNFRVLNSPRGEIFFSFVRQADASTTTWVSAIGIS